MYLNITINMDFEAHREALLKKARFLVSNEMDAEDLVQDTFVSAILMHKHYTEMGKMFAWLNKIMININRNNYRKIETVFIDFNDSKHQRLISAQELPATPTTKPALS